MMTAQRRSELKKYMLEHKSASVLEMARRFSVSGQTIRRDFEVLENEGFLLRSYGGAMVKDRKAVTETICRLAASRIYPNDCIFIDHSTTALALCPEIRRMPLTVLTNSYRVVGQLAGCANIKVISTGGVFHDRQEGFFGLETVRYLEQHCVDKAFLSCRSVDFQRGVSDSDELTANVRQTVIENADSVYLLADHTKFGKTGFITVCPLERLTAVITDHPMDERWRRLLAEKQVDLLEAGTGEEEPPADEEEE